MAYVLGQDPEFDAWIAGEALPPKPPAPQAMPVQTPAAPSAPDLVQAGAPVAPPQAAVAPPPAMAQVQAPAEAQAPSVPSLGEWINSQAKSGRQQIDGAPDDTPRDPDMPLRLISGIFDGLAGKQYDSKFWGDRNLARKDKEKRDPNSQSSIRARASMAPMLAQLGFGDQDIAGMSAYDLESAGGPKQLMSQLATIKANNATFTRNQQATKEAEVRTGNTAADKLERAKNAGAIAAQNQAQGAASSLANAQTMAQTNDALASKRAAEDDARAAATQKQMQEDRQAFEREMKAREEQYKIDHPTGGTTGLPLKADDLEGTGWSMGSTPEERASSERIANRRGLTKQTVDAAKDAAVAIRSIDDLIKNRKEHGSQASGMNQSVAQSNDLYGATVKSNYMNAMKLPNTDSTTAEMNRLFPDANAVMGHGVGGAIQGIAHQVGLASDPVLEQLESTREEMIRNLSGKIGIPNARWVGGASAHDAPDPGSTAQPAHAAPRRAKKPDVTASASVPAAEPVAAPPAAKPGVIRARDPKTGAEGDYAGTAAEARAEGLEVL